MNDMLCDKNLLQHMEANLNNFTRQSLQQGNLKRAAVAITIVDIEHDPDLYDIPHKNTWNRNAAIILTRRASRLKNHAGQWALPGGRMDTGETPAETALRELEEEVGLRLDMDRVIGQLDDYSTRSGFIISPVVVWGGTSLILTPNRAEVESIHRIPLAEFLRTDAPILQEIPGSENPVLLMPIGRGSIASPTAAMLYQFREVAIFGRSIRVAHYEQPYFAWQ
jgi:8-oxo-dGTP pyrophosphatase MutT (NUDIX family)